MLLTVGVIGGHCGFPFTQIIAGRLWHNAGVIGMPANDGTPRVWYSLLRPTRGGLEISHRAFAYDHWSTAAKMRRVGLPDGYADAGHRHRHRGAFIGGAALGLLALGAMSAHREYGRERCNTGPRECRWVRGACHRDRYGDYECEEGYRECYRLVYCD